MPRISTFLYCEEIIKNEQNKNQLLLSNPLTVFRPAFVPGMFSFSIVFGVSGMNPSLKEYRLQLKFINAIDANTPIIDTGIIPISQDPNIPGPVNDLPEEYQGILINLDFRNAVLKNEGEYYTEVVIDDELMGRYPIYVKGAG